MSLQTWCGEFYPIPADAVPETDALAHSLRKWEGLRPESLQRHGLHPIRFTSPHISDSEDYLAINNTSCALCHHYLDGNCNKCPLAISRGGTPCDGTAIGELRSPWNAYRYTFSPEPMIAALKMAAQSQAAVEGE